VAWAHNDYKPCGALPAQHPERIWRRWPDAARANGQSDGNYRRCSEASTPTIPDQGWGVSVSRMHPSAAEVESQNRLVLGDLEAVQPAVGVVVGTRSPRHPQVEAPRGIRC